MADALPLTFQREVTRIARRFKVRPRRGFVVCTCADMDVRRAVEAALQEQLGADSLARAELTAEASDAWRAVIDARGAGDRVVALHLPDAPAEAMLRSLDVQRELLHGVGVALLVWMPAADLERFSRLAPNLWSVRGHLAEFRTHADVELTAARKLAGSKVPRRSLEEELVRVDEDIRWSLLGRTALLLERADLLQLLGRPREALATLERATPLLGFRDLGQRSWWLRMRFFALCALEQYDAAEKTLGELSTLAPPGDWGNHCRLLTLRAALHRHRGEWAPMLGLLDGLWRTLQSHRAGLGDARIWLAVAFVNAANCTLRPLGQVDLTSVLLDRTTAMLPQRITSADAAITTHRDELLGSIAWERLELDDAIERWQMARSIALNTGNDVRAHWIEEVMRGAFDALGASGLPRPSPVGIPRTRPTQYESDGMIPPRPPEAPLVETPESPPLTPYRRLVLAIDEVQMALPGDHDDAVAGSLTACQAAWDAEDPRCRSLYLYAAWKFLELRALARSGSVERSRTTFSTAAAQLRSLPFTRLDFLAEFASLPCPHELLPERRRAALEVLHTARPLGLIALEQRAQAALATIDALSPATLPSAAA